MNQTRTGMQLMRLRVYAYMRVSAKQEQAE